LSTVKICLKIVIKNCIKSRIKFTASNLSLFIAIHSPSVFVGANSYFSVTRIRHIFIWIVFLKMTDTSSSKNIEINSRIILYMRATNRIRIGNSHVRALQCRILIRLT
jgi:hypothetical protein